MLLFFHINAIQSPRRNAVKPRMALQRSFSTRWQTLPFFDDDTRLFQQGNHDKMRDDQRRTPRFYEAIRARLQQAADDGSPPLTVLDLGTGPYALLALEAARAGAGRVYAIEADAESAQRAREAVADAGFSEVVEIIEGISVDVELPERVDLLVSETVGAVASEEGLYATYADAHSRLVKEPQDRKSWIPHTVQTMGAPCTYLLHHGLGHPAYEWLDYNPLAGPPRPESDDDTVAILADPQALETVRFFEPDDLLHMLDAEDGVSTRSHTLAGAPAEPVAFSIDGERLASNEVSFRTGLVAEGASSKDAEFFAQTASRSLSGIALWPRLELDPSSKTIVEARGGLGEPRASSWPTLLPLLQAQPLPVGADDCVGGAFHIELSDDIQVPPAYTLEATVETKASALEGSGRSPQETREVNNGSGDAGDDGPFGLMMRLALPLNRLRLGPRIREMLAASLGAGQPAS